MILPQKGRTALDCVKGLLLDKTSQKRWALGQISHLLTDEGAECLAASDGTSTAETDAREFGMRRTFRYRGKRLPKSMKHGRNRQVDADIRERRLEHLSGLEDVSWM